MSPSLALVLMAVLLAVWLLYRRGQASNKDTGATTRTETLKTLGDTGKQAARSKVAHKATEYHAVSIRVPGAACDAAKALKGQRFLSSEAPLLPLADCDAAECSCTFAHHADRRAGDDRRGLYGGVAGSSTGSHPVEQRKSGERRKSDDDFDVF